VLVGITVIITEESYTSKASFLDRDALPTYPRDTQRGCVTRIGRG